MPMRFIVTLLCCTISPPLGFSQAPFFQGKTVKIINNDPGGTAGLRVKSLMPFLRKHIPGNPTVVISSWRVAAGAERPIIYFRTPNLTA